MCEQTEINYLDGDVVWVKLGACWWPGQVTGPQNLPEDLQREFEKKSLIAAVRFFQEDTYELVKNYQQIYKYNCTLKDEFIKKGLDKYRSKVKDGGNYMDKFPGDIETAEKLTGGDPNILNDEKFSPEEKPDISALFGDKKIQKKKKNPVLRRSEGGEMLRKITHPRFLRESDHEVRIRQQPSSLPSTPNITNSPSYPCHLCSFTCTRVNVIICHLKSHNSGGIQSPSAPTKSKVKTYSQSRNSILDTDTPKRKYVRKEKSYASGGTSSGKSKNENSEPVKRKQTKQNEKSSKKKKTDPELREKLLADWDDGSEEEIGLDTTENKSFNLSSTISTPPTDNNVSNLPTDNKEEQKKDSSEPDKDDILLQTEELLKETEKLSTIHKIESTLNSNNHSNKSLMSDDFVGVAPNFERGLKLSKYESVIKSKKLLESSASSTSADKKNTGNSVSEQDDKKSRLSCFDFDEEDPPEPPFPPVRKIPRVFGEKNLSLKKEIIKEFELSQALKTEKHKTTEKLPDLSTIEKVIYGTTERFSKNKSEDQSTNAESNLKSKNDDDKSVNDEPSKTEEKFHDEKNYVETPKPPEKVCETQVEIVEIFEVEKEMEDESSEGVKNDGVELLKSNDVLSVENQVKELSMDTEEEAELEENQSSKNKEVKKFEESTKPQQYSDTASTKDLEETLSEQITTETEDDTVSESVDTLIEQSEHSDIDIFDRKHEKESSENKAMDSPAPVIVEQPVIKRKRGRPRKTVEPLDVSKLETTNNQKLKNFEENSPTETSEPVEIEKKVSESEPERSHSGRKRKPNKKYLESDIYVQDTDQRSFKPDENLSESDEKFLEIPKTKSKRGRKPSEHKRESNLKTKAKEQEIELSNKTLDISHKEESLGIGSDKIHVEDQLLEMETKITENRFEKFQESIQSSIILEDPENPMQMITKESPMDTINEDLKELRPKSVETSSEIASDLSQKHDVANETKQQDNVKEVKESTTTNEESDKSRLQVSKSIEMLPPKKSQIKKFELSQIDFFGTSTTANKSVVEVSESEKKSAGSIMETSSPSLKDQTSEINANAAPVGETKSTIIPITEETPPVPKENAPMSEIASTQAQDDNIEKTMMEMELETTSTLEEVKTVDNTDKSVHENKSSQAKYIAAKPVAAEVSNTVKGDLFPDEKPVNTFQEAFLKTLRMDKRVEEFEHIIGRGKKGRKGGKKKVTEIESSSTVVVTDVSNVKIENQQPITDPPSSSPASVSVEMQKTPEPMSNFEGVEVVVEENVEVETKLEDTIFQNTDNQLSSTPSKFDIEIKPENQHMFPEETVKNISLEIQKQADLSRTSTPTLSPNPDVSMPVKKREMPRIIENVALTEPMQILKTKLLDKLPQKGTKHKLESDYMKKGMEKGGSRAKVMKLEQKSPNSKTKTVLQSSTPRLSLAKKSQILKSEDVESPTVMETQNEKLIVQSNPNQMGTPVTEKYIQQSSQSLADMDLDINSMPFVLSEDVLTPESIEQMPVVISSIIPASTAMPTTLSFTPASTQIVTTNQTQFKLTNESTPEISSPKKKSGTPAILKNKSKAKPTITSIKTIVPPLTGGVKGLKFHNTPGKASPLLTQRGTPGKFVVVQTSGGQQLRYSVQSSAKPNSQQKIAIPTGKNTGNAQVVQQGGKVVILTSAQSGQTKMLPLNISKQISGKVQRIVTSKGQVFSPISSANMISSQTVLSSNADTASPTTSKLPSTHKIINTQGIVTSKGVLTPLSGTITKTALLNTLSQGIITKGGIYTPISASTLGGKALLGGKTLLTKSGAILSSQNLGTSKAILTPITQSIGGKTILSTSGIIAPKGTVLTPITGQQVKAIAAKSPTKGKAQYQTIQQKVQLQTLAKSSQQKSCGTSKSPSSTVVFQNTTSPKGGAQSGKKAQSKGKADKTTTPRGRQTKAQQKIIVQQFQQDSPVAGSAGQHMQTKQHIIPSTDVPLLARMGSSQKSPATSVSTPKFIGKGHSMNKGNQRQKNLSNLTINSATASTLNKHLSTPLSLPPLETIESEKKTATNVESTPEESKEQMKPETVTTEQGGSESEKVDEPKTATQPQIMALPTESSDGTQTYVLVTIDEQGQIQPLDNNTLMSLEGTTQNPDGTRTLYIDPSSLGEAGTLDNIVLQFDNGIVPNAQTSTTTEQSSGFSSSSEVVQTSNQDILAAALANTDFQQEINLPENPTASVMTTGLTQTSLINQTILQSTIIPPTEPISSPSVLETSLTLNQPIMTPLEVPSNLPIQSETPTSVVSTIPSSLDLPITITNPNISYITAGGETQIRIPGNSMPDIGEIIENQPTATDVSRSTEIPPSTQYLMIPNLNQNIPTPQSQVQSTDVSIPSVSYSVSIPNTMVMENPPAAQTTPSMPIIDDNFPENNQFASSVQENTIVTEQSFVDVPVSEMLVSKAPSVVSTESTQMQDVVVTSEMNISSEEVPITTEEIESEKDPVSSVEITLSTDNPVVEESSPKDTEKEKEDEQDFQTSDQNVPTMTSSMPIIDDGSAIPPESSTKIQESVEPVTVREEVSDSSPNEVQVETEAATAVVAGTSEELTEEKFSHMKIDDDSSHKDDDVPIVTTEEQSNEESLLHDQERNDKDMEVDDEANESKVYPVSTVKQSEEEYSTNEVPSSREEIRFEEANAEVSQEVPSQSYEQFNLPSTDNSVDLPSQSAMKSENSREATQSIPYEPMETDEDTMNIEPPTQSFEHSERNNEATQSTQSYEISTETNTNTPTQSFNEVMQNQEDRLPVDEEIIDDPSFPTQSYEVEKMENLSENLETDAELSQEGNIPSQSNDIGNDGIGTSSVSTNNSGLNEDETASSSYVPETPETQERDQDQESAISTSSYEIPPCEELNIASSSVIPDTSVRAEHTSIHDNGVPEIPTSSYNLNPDITSTHVDSVPTSSYEDQVVVEQNVSTSYQVPISMPGLEETSQNFVTESTDHRNEPSSYYTHNPEVTASYYESVDQETNSRMEEDSQEQVTPSYYDRSSQEASQSYFTPAEATPSYSSHSVSPSYYETRPETEASQSFYSSEELEKNDRSTSQNVEASPSFYTEQSDELRLRQQGEATPTYSERYPVDYTLDNSPMERHDLVESSVSATKPTER